MANWIKAIYFVVILAWVIYVLSDDAVKYKSYHLQYRRSHFKELKELGAERATAAHPLSRQGGGFVWNGKESNSCAGDSRIGFNRP